jgi:hypothetical protein
MGAEGRPEVVGLVGWVVPRNGGEEADGNLILSDLNLRVLYQIEKETGQLQVLALIDFFKNQKIRRFQKSPSVSTSSVPLAPTLIIINLSTSQLCPSLLENTLPNAPPLHLQLLQRFPNSFDCQDRHIFFSNCVHKSEFPWDGGHG